MPPLDNTVVNRVCQRSCVVAWIDKIDRMAARDQQIDQLCVACPSGIVERGVAVV